MFEAHSRILNRLEVFPWTAYLDYSMVYYDE